MATNCCGVYAPEELLDSQAFETGEASVKCTTMISILSLRPIKYIGKIGIMGTK